MPSFTHEATLFLLRERPTLARDLLCDVLGVAVPKHSAVRIDSENLSDLVPAVFHADLVVLLLTHANKPVHGIVVEVQRSPKPAKLLSWPAYAANLRVRHGVPTSVLVVCTNERTARWAARPIPLGPGSVFTPQVLGPSGVPLITDPQHARREPELAVFSAMAHGRDADAQPAAAAVAAALHGIAPLDAERSRVYFDLLWAVASPAVKRKLQTMDLENYQYRSAFAKRYLARGLREGKREGQREGKLEGKLEGRAELVIRQLTRRFGPLPAAIPEVLARASLAELDAMGERLLDAPTLADALGFHPESQ